jgi:outer membrane autotransporter protein
MKKILAIVAVALFTATAAQAQGFGSVEYGSRDGVDGNADSNAVKVTLGSKINENVSVDVSSRFAKQDGSTSNNTTRLEAGVTGTMPLASGFSIYTRGAVGERFTSTGDNSYYAVEPGVKYAVTPALTAKVGYRYRDAFTSSDNDLTRTWRLGADYALTKQHSIGLGYDRVRGDSNFNAITVNVGMKF